jgi:ElaB/YqjD/DUF883 family membrane-anchored ribosome-binding protein
MVLGITEAKVAGLPPNKELKNLIEQAMLEKAPGMHLELVASGTLDKVLSERASQAEDSFELAKSQVVSEALKASRKLTDAEATSEIMQGTNEAAREALNQAVEFETPPEEQITEPQPVA